MKNSVNTDSAKVFMSGQSQAVRLPKKYRFDEACGEVAVRRVGRHLILSPRFSNWEDYWANSTRPSADFVDSVLNRKVDELPTEERESFD
jgi:antitoxin VapB